VNITFLFKPRSAYLIQPTLPTIKIKKATKKQPQNFLKFTDSAGLPVNPAKPADSENFNEADS